jgi:hypothetical protein
MIVKGGMLQSMRRTQIIVAPIARVDDVRVNPTTEICNCERACDLDTSIRCLREEAYCARIGIFHC